MPQFIQGKAAIWRASSKTATFKFDARKYDNTNASISHNTFFSYARSNGAVPLRSTPRAVTARFEIETDEYHIASFESHPVILETKALGACVGLFLVCPQTKSVLFLHSCCYNPTLEENIVRILSEFESVGAQLMGAQAILFAGRSNYQDSIDTGDTLIKLLQERGVVLDVKNLFPRQSPEEPQLTSSVLFNSETNQLSIKIHDGPTIMRSWCPENQSASPVSNSC